MKFKDLKPDSYVKWQSNRGYKKWNTFGKVTNLTKYEVTILTYDDLNEAKLSKDGEAIKEEVELITKDEFVDNLKRELAKLNTEKFEIEILYNNKIKKIDSLIEYINEDLSKI